MKLLILGATGGTGLQLVRQSLELNHEVAVLTRNRSKLNHTHERLTVLEGNVLDEKILLKALEGKDAVLSALGRGKSLNSSNLISKAVSTLIPAMNATGVKRVVFLSSFGVGQTFRQANFIQKIIFRTFLRDIYADKARADERICSSSLEWTLVHPVALTNAPFTGTYIVGEKLPMKGLPKISRADVAHFMLLQLNDPGFLRKTIIVSTN